MKKQALSVFAALLALAGLLTAWALAASDAAELSAENTAYAILYEDGELVFQNSSAPDGRTVKATYEVDLTAVYTYHIFNPPWFNEKESILVVNFADKISPTSTNLWFSECSNLKRVDNIQNLDTSRVTNMEEMFQYCGSLTELDASHFDTSNVTNMYGMFFNCRALAALDVSNFNTANVTNMRGMFALCDSVTALDVSRFDTANVTNMDAMFNGCSKLTELDVSHFDTANVTDMGYMFQRCSGLASLDVSHFDTANVTTMEAMFNGCSALTALDVSHFDTANVTNMWSMFNDCSGLTALDLSSFNTSNVTNISDMFIGCNLTALDLSSFNTSNVTDMSYMFSGCFNLKTVCVSDKFTTASVTKSDRMFFRCWALVGGAGTEFDENHMDKEYARIDGGASAPGYFTAKGAAPVAYAITAAVTTNGELSVTLSNPDAATVAVSYFDASGKFVAAQLQEIQANAGTVTLALASGAKTARVMLLDNAFRPLCAAYGATV